MGLTKQFLVLPLIIHGRASTKNFHLPPARAGRTREEAVVLATYFHVEFGPRHAAIYIYIYIYMCVCVCVCSWAAVFHLNMFD